MARFRAWIEGRYGNQASRMGDEMVLAEVTAQKVGVYVEAWVNPKGEDEVRVYATQGRLAAGTHQHQYLGRVRRTEAGVSFEPEPEVSRP